MDGDLYYFNYSQYIDPDLIKEFQAKYDIKVIESYFDSMSGLLAKLQGGNAYDVITPTAEFVEKLIQTEQVLRIPIEKLRNFENIYPYFDDPWYDPGSEHSVPYSMYLTGIGYRADLLDNMTGSWEDLANPEAAGRIYVLDDYPGGDRRRQPAQRLRPQHGRRSPSSTPSRDWLVDLKPLLRGFSVDTITNMSSGNAWIQHLWNGDIMNIRYRVDDPDAYQFEKCSEGNPVGSDAFMIPVNAEHPGTALLFMDFMLDPKIAARNCQWTGYPMPNSGADQAFAEIAKDDPNIVVTPQDLENGDQFANLPDAERRLWDRTWVEVKAGMSENRFANLMLAPGGLWLVLVFRSRSGSSSRSRFRSRNDTYLALYGWNPGNYADVFDPLFAPVLLRSVLFALATVVLCLLIGYPIAYYIARFGGSWKTVLIALVVVPFLVNYLSAPTPGSRSSPTRASQRSDRGHRDRRGRRAVRQHAVGGDRRARLRLPRVHDPAHLREPRPHGPVADRSGEGPLRDALADVSPRDLPASFQGVAAGCVLVFLPAVGDFVAAQLLGGPNTYMVGNLVQQEFLEASNWPFGSALTTVMMGFLLIFMLFYLRTASRATREARA